MADDEFSMSDSDFGSYDDENPRVTRVISPKSIQTNPVLAGIEAIAQALSSTSLIEDESESEDDQLFGYKGQPVETSNTKKGKRNVAVVKPNTKNNDGKMASNNTKQKKTKATKGKKVVQRDDDEEEYSSEASPSTKTKQSSPDLQYGSRVAVNEVPERKMGHSDEDHIDERDDEMSDGESAQAVISKKPSQAQRKKTAKQTSKASKKGKTDDFNHFISNDQQYKEKGEYEGNGIAASRLVVIGAIEEEMQMPVKNDGKLKSSKRGKKDKLETQNPLDTPEEISKTTDENKVGEVIPNVSRSNNDRKGKQSKEEKNKGSEIGDSKQEERAVKNPSRNKRLGKKDPIDPSSEIENEDTEKTKNPPTELGKNEIAVYEKTSPPLSSKGRQKNTRKEDKQNEKQPLKELSNTKEEKPAPKKRNLKNVPEDIDTQHENDEISSGTKHAPKKKNAKVPSKVGTANMVENEQIEEISETNPAPKKKNARTPSEMVTDSVENEPIEKAVSKGKNVRTNAKKNKIDKEQTKTTKSKKGEIKMQEGTLTEQTVPEETATKRTLRNRNK